MAPAGTVNVKTIAGIGGSLRWGDESMAQTDVADPT